MQVLKRLLLLQILDNFILGAVVFLSSIAVLEALKVVIIQTGNFWGPFRVAMLVWILVLFPLWNAYIERFPAA